MGQEPEKVDKNEGVSGLGQGGDGVEVLSMVEGFREVGLCGWGG